MSDTSTPMEPAESVKVVVEIPKGSRNKYERNSATGEIELDRRLFASVSYPTEYGYVADTAAEDGDELDALVAVTEPTFSGCVIHARPVALLQMRDPDGAADDKVFCVPLNDPAWETLHDVDDIPDDLRAEIVHFFKVYADIRGTEPEVHGWASADEARTAIARARERLDSDSATREGRSAG